MTQRGLYYGLYERELWYSLVQVFWARVAVVQQHEVVTDDSAEHLAKKTGVDLLRIGAAILARTLPRGACGRHLFAQALVFETLHTRHKLRLFRRGEQQRMGSGDEKPAGRHRCGGRSPAIAHAVDHPLGVA